MLDTDPMDGSGSTAERGVSPAVGTVLLLAIVVVLVIILANFMFGIGKPQFAQADVIISEGDGGVSVQLAHVERANTVYMLANGTRMYTWQPSGVGNIVKLSGLEPGSSVTVVAEHEGKATVVRTYTVTRGPNATGPPTIVNITETNPPGTSSLSCPTVVDDSGGADFKTIQGAVNDGNCDTIIVKEGTYPETVNVNRSVRIRAAVGATPVVEDPGTTLTPVMTVNADSVVLYGLNVSTSDSPGVRVNGHEGTILRNMTVTSLLSVATPAVQVRNGAVVQTIEGSTFKHSTVGTVISDESTVRYYRNNRLTNLTEAGVNITDSGTRVVIVRNNRISGAEATGYVSNGATLQLYANNTVSGSGPQYVHDATVGYIVNNEFRNMSNGGVWVWDSLVERVSNNTFTSVRAENPGLISSTHNVEYHAIYLRNSTSIAVTNNTIHRVAESGISIEYGSVERVSSNHISQAGILANETSGYTESLFLNHTVVEDVSYNTLGNTTHAQYEIKVAWSVVEDSIHHNLVNNSSANTGITIYRPIERTVIRRNTIRNSSMSGTAIWAYVHAYKGNTSILVKRNLVLEPDAGSRADALRVTARGSPHNYSTIHAHRNSFRDVYNGVYVDEQSGASASTGVVQAQRNYFNDVSYKEAGDTGHINTSNPLAGEPSPVGR